MPPDGVPPMTPEEFTAEMKRLAYGPEYADDWDDQHRAMDCLMVDYLRQLGLGEAMDAYDAPIKYYS